MTRCPAIPAPATSRSTRSRPVHAGRTDTTTCPSEMPRQDDRVALLKRLGRWYGEQRCAIAWTVTNRVTGPNDTRPKQVQTKGWQHTRPLGSGDAGEAVFGRGLTSNPALVPRPSGLTGLDCDSEQDLAAIDRLGLPTTITVRSSQPYKRHFWFRPPSTLETVQFAAFRFEGGAVTADEHRYLLCPPAIHPSGVEYAFLPGLGPGEVEIAELSDAQWRTCVELAEASQQRQRELFRLDPDAKVTVGDRHDRVFRFACSLRNWMSTEEEILAATLAWNEGHCEPPMEEARVRSQVRGAMKVADRPPDPEEAELRRQADELLRDFLDGHVGPAPPVADEKPSPSKRRRELRRRATSAIEARPVEWLVANVGPDRHAQPRRRRRRARQERARARLGGRGHPRGRERARRQLRGRGRTGDPPALRGARRRPGAAVRAVDRPAGRLDLVPARPG
jgi:Bifunctional DNA primase/polymerase, N-terminal/Primase C terminal 1 (PriCT-1)